MFLRAVIIEDELSGQQTLLNLLKKYCPSVQVLAFADSVPTGIQVIQDHKPDLVFLDVELKLGSGFEILNALTDYQFGLVFTTAFDQYAVKAFKYAALDYLLKPIDIIELQKAIHKVLEQKWKNEYLNQKWEVLKNNLIPNNNHQIAIPIPNGYDFVQTKEINYCEADGNYTNIVLAQQSPIISAKNLGYYESMLDTNLFFRISRKHIVNVSQIKKLKNTKKPSIILKNNVELYVSAQKKRLYCVKLQTFNLIIFKKNSLHLC